MGRKPIGKRPMTAAERQRRRREKLGMKPRNPVGKALVEAAVGKGWKTVPELQELLGQNVTEKELENAAKRNKITVANPYRIDTALSKSGKKFRVVEVSVVPDEKIAEWKVELIPILKDIAKELAKPRVQRSDSSMSAMANRIRRVLDSIT